MNGPSCSAVASLRRHHRDESSAVHDRDAIGRGEHFGEVGAHEQDGLARARARTQLLVDELDGADVDTARRLRREQHA